MGGRGARGWAVSRFGGPSCSYARGMDINDVMPVSEARRDFSALIRRSSPTVIGKSGKAEAVVMSVDYYRANFITDAAESPAADREEPVPDPAPEVV